MTETVARMEREGIAVAPWVTEMLGQGITSFYRRDDGQLGRLRPEHEAVRAGGSWSRRTSTSRALKAAGKELAAKRGASLVDLGDGVLCLEFHSKANAIGSDALTLAGQALDLLASDDAWRALVDRQPGRVLRRRRGPDRGRRHRAERRSESDHWRS